MYTIPDFKFYKIFLVVHDSVAYYFLSISSINTDVQTFTHIHISWMYIKFGKYPPLLINKFSYTLETQLSFIPYDTILFVLSSVV